MLKALFDGVMRRRALRLLELIGDWLPARGPVLDLGSGTGHLAERVERARGVEVVTADVGDMHVVGRAPVVVADGVLPFEADTFSAALLLFMLAYPDDAAGVLAEAARVTAGPVVVVQTLHADLAGYLWLRVREFVWTVVAFHVSKVVGYVPRKARFTMATRRFFSARELERTVALAGLCIRARRQRRVLPGRSLLVTAWLLERHV